MLSVFKEVVAPTLILSGSQSLLACRMAEGQVDGLTSMFEEFWAAQKKEEIASASRPRTQAPPAAAAASPSGAPAKTGRAKGQPSRAKAKEAAADGSSKSAEAQTLSRHDADRAADVAGGASGKKLATQGGSTLCL